MRNIKFNFEDLKVYQNALDFIDTVYEDTKCFPKSKDYALSSQFKKASVSIALNIAEGSGDTNAQFKRFLNMANGSIKECVVCSTIAKPLNYLSSEVDYKNRVRLEELSKMVSGLQKYLKSNDKNTNV